MTIKGACGGLVLSLVMGSSVFAQYATDAFRYSEINQTGTARFQALGGNHTALGGDAATISGNPAGLGFYNRSEFSLSPSLSNINTESQYIGNTTSANKSNFNVSNASLIITSKPDFQRKWKRSSFGISYSRQQSLQNSFRYSGVNNKSAYVDQVVQDADRVGWSDKDYDDEFYDNMQTVRYVDHAYYNLQMIYPTKFISTTEGSGAPYARDDSDKVSNQSGQFDATGANTQWTLAYAGNYNDKLYVGGSVGFNRIKYSYTNSFEDSFVNPTVFRSSVKGENLTVTGNGVNATFGIIYKFSPVIQIGGALTSPTFMRIRETFNQYVTADYINGSIRNDQGQDVGPTIEMVSLVPNDFEYSITSPLRGSAGLTYFFKDKGFITGSLEYVGYGAMRARTKFNSDDALNKEFNDDNKTEIQDTYKSGVNVRVGGEYRAGLFRGRLGIAYLSDPYLHTDGVDRSKLLLSAGVGVRSNRFFADISGTLNTYKSAYTPYVLNNAADYSSVNISNRAVNVVLSVGTFF
ncbi:hypothetical protein [Dyadobacter psychrotolerans]|uniref:Aromatic hydrocarbon degradation protein n=1 Tax=Dyadobacter psychrotolerans TaxID=2541721 RepID=A0A4R5E170_9BACT|nr:hypothetical protein [Dyadobacter psychrotolerans]TDE17433.1 hypothetical protein E0F88_05960 [Dyadobacter psychrotolerans]